MRARAGFGHAVAPLGTALTENQIELMWRLAPEPVLCFDGDRAGLAAAFRAVERVLPLLRPGHSLRFALLPEGKDPDDLVGGEGAEAFAQVLTQALPLAEMVWEKEVQEGRWDTPERRAMLEARIDAAVRRIGDGKVREHYTQALRERVQRLFAKDKPRQDSGRRDAWRPPRGAQARAGDRGRFGRSGVPPATPQLRRSSLVRGDDGVASREALLVLTMINHPELLDGHCEEFAQIEIRDRELDKLRNEIIDVAALSAPLDRAKLRDHLDQRELLDIAQRLADRTTLKSEVFARPEADLDEAEAGWLHTLFRYRRASVLQTELKAAERALAQDMTDENLARLQAIHAQLERTEANWNGLSEEPDRPAGI